MTATFKTLLALLFLLVQGAALAEPVPAPLTPSLESAQAPAPCPVKEHLAWQRVGSPLMAA